MHDNFLNEKISVELSLGILFHVVCMTNHFMTQGIIINRSR